MMCQKCSECQENIPGKEVLEIVVEKIKQKNEKTKRKPRAASEYNKFLSEYLKRPELKDILPKLRMSKAAEAWKELKQQS